MRFLSLLAVFALAWSCGFASANLNFDKSIIAKFNADVDNWNRALTADYPTKRSLRRTDENDEERKFKQVDDLVEKADDVLGKVAHTSPKVKNSAWAIVKLDDFQAKLNVLKKYPQGLDSKTMAQLAKVEEQRLKDVALLKQMNKKKPDGLQRPMEITPGMKVAPVQVSHVGRDNQRYAEDGSRLLSCVVVSRPAKQGGGDVLLISSSNPNKQEWLLPKGGWDNGESIHKAAWREAIEEGGVNGAFTASLGDLKFKNEKGKPYIYHAFKMKGVTVYDQWSESMRYRLWVSYDDAIKLLGNRKEMIEIVNRARAASAA